jgi:hypothetical protein
MDNARINLLAKRESLVAAIPEPPPNNTLNELVLQLFNLRDKIQGDFFDPVEFRDWDGEFDDWKDNHSVDLDQFVSSNEGVWKDFEDARTGLRYYTMRLT